MKKITRLAARQKAVGNILASWRIESLVPSGVVVQGLKACVAGAETTEKVLAEVVRKHVALRRG